MAKDDLGALTLSPEHAALLRTYGFDMVAFTHLRNELRQGRFPPDRNRLAEPVTPPVAADLTAWPQGAAADALRARGQAVIDAGQAAVAILNGGMATRFGGRVKGVVEVADGASFLGLKLRDVARAGGASQVFLMNSFATDRATRAHLEENAYFGLDPARVHIVCQRISLRLTPGGGVFRDAAGSPSFYAPGHGDLLAALDASPAFRRLAATPGAAVMVSNVDNLGATLDPLVLGAHLAGGRPMTTEVAQRAAGDAGGAPVRRGGRLEVLEGFRLPAGFDPASLPVFNTNTFVFDAAAIRGDTPLTWFRADKQVADQPVVQFERLLGEVTATLDATYLEVPRAGPATRFMPVKAPADLAAVQAQVRTRFGL